MTLTMAPQSASAHYEDLEAILIDFRSHEEGARTVKDGPDDSELNWRPHARASWSVLQCIEHLALTNRIYTDAMLAAMRVQRTRPRSSPVKPGVFGALFSKKLEPPVTKKIRAPRRIEPMPDRNKSEVVDGLLQTHEKIRDTIAVHGQFDLNRILFRNPFIPLLRVRVGTGLLIMAAHERRHLWQAWQTRAELEK